MTSYFVNIRHMRGSFKRPKGGFALNNKRTKNSFSDNYLYKSYIEIFVSCKMQAQVGDDHRDYCEYHYA